MVIDTCEVKPSGFPETCLGCPWIGRCDFTVKIEIVQMKKKLEKE